MRGKNILEEAIESGIEDIIIVTGKEKHAIEDHFDHDYELEETLLKRGEKDRNLSYKESYLLNLGDSLFEMVKRKLESIFNGNNL